MDVIFILSCAIVLMVLYSVHRFQQVKRKTVRFIDYPNPLDYSDEYVSAMNDMEMNRLRQV